MAFAILSQVAITAATLFVAYKVWERSQPPSPVAEKPQPKAEPIEQPTPPPQTQEPPPPVEPPPEPEPEPTPPVDPFDGLPWAVTLPLSTDRKLTLLTSAPQDATATLLTNYKQLEYDGPTLRWEGKAFAGLRVEDSQLEFVWMDGVSEDAEAAMRNSAVRLEHHGIDHVLALRKPVAVPAPTLDLKSAELSIYCKCDFPPPPADVRFSLIVGAQLPVAEFAGGDAVGMKARDEVVMRYKMNGDAATKVSVRKSGDVLAVKLATQYVLPSGDVEPLTITKGNRRLTQLENLADSAAAASNALPNLIQYYRGLEGDLGRAQSMDITVNTDGGYVENPVAVAQKAAAIRAVQREMIATNRQLARARQLVDDRPAIEQELAAIRQVAEFAQSLKGASLPYRFYAIVGGHEVDLVVAE